MTDRDRLLAFLKANKGREINAFTEIVNGLHILEYTGRLTDCRKKIGCTCASGLFCSAKEHIVNTRKGYYKYVDNSIKTDVVERSEEMLTYEEKLKKRAEIAEQWRTADPITKVRLKAQIYGLGLTKEELNVERVKKALIDQPLSGHGAVEQ